MNFTFQMFKMLTLLKLAFLRSQHQQHLSTVLHTDLPPK